MANRTRSDDTADGKTGSSSSGETAPNEVGDENEDENEDETETATTGYRLPAERVEELRNLADRIDALAETLPLGAARHHARKAAAAARTAADDEVRLVTRRAAVGELVTELRTAADEAASTRDQYRLLETLYEEALPATRSASETIYD